MAGTNTSKRDNAQHPVSAAPAVILVNPQLGENIGMCARAMLNCGVTELRLVAPRDGWPNPAAITSSSGAIEILDNAKVYATTAEAVADLEYVFATTARGRDMVKDVYTAEAAGKKIRETNARAAAGEQKCGILFGPERTGLQNDDVVLANAILHIPLNPGFSSLNLAQAVLLVCYSWLSADNPFASGEVLPALGETAPATRGEIDMLMAHLEDELERNKFFKNPDQRPTIMRNIRNFFFRSGATQQDVRTLHGVFSCLTGKKSWK